jgi:hypothetical protein
MLRSSLWGGVTGIVGLYAGVSSLVSTWTLSPETLHRGSLLYVTFRVPHHAMPSVPLNQIPVIVACVVFLAFLARNKDARLRLLGAYGLATLVFACVGGLLVALEQYDLLKFYWFRFPDTMIPFLTELGICAMLNSIMMGTAGPALVQVVRRVALVALVLITLIPVAGASRRLVRPHVERPQQAALSWIRAATRPSDRILLAADLPEFYVEAERARVVGFVHSPQDESNVIEWHERLLALSGGKPVKEVGFAAVPELVTAFQSLSDQELINLARRYRAQYCLVHADQNRDLPVVYRDQFYEVLRMTDAL